MANEPNGATVTEIVLLAGALALILALLLMVLAAI